MAGSGFCGSQAGLTSAGRSIAGADVALRGPAPELGQHTDEVLTELGLSADELSALAADEVIGRP